MRELDWPDKPIPWQDRLPRSRPLTPRKEAAVHNLNACDLCGDQTYGGSALCEDCAVVVTEREEVRLPGKGTGVSATIKSVFKDSPWSLEVGSVVDLDDATFVKLISEWGILQAAVAVSTADLLAALDAVPRVPEQPPLADRERDLLGPQNDDGRYWHGRAMENLRKAELATTRAEKAEAERDALAATVERVRDVAHEFYKVRGDWYTEGGANALKAALLAALDPKPAFVLPTEAGAGIMARDCSGDESELRLFACGSWVDQLTGCDWSPERVLSEWTDHRLLDGAE